MLGNGLASQSTVPPQVIGMHKGGVSSSRLPDDQVHGIYIATIPKLRYRYRCPRNISRSYIPNTCILLTSKCRLPPRRPARHHIFVGGRLWPVLARIMNGEIKRDNTVRVEHRHRLPMRM